MLKPVVYKNHNISIFNNKTLSEANASLFFVIARNATIKTTPLFLLLVFADIV